MKWKANPNIAIHCAICLNMTADLIPATTVVAGYAVCKPHVKAASVPGFSLFTLMKEHRRGV